jgi:hypothetical protein
MSVCKAVSTNKVLASVASLILFFALAGCGAGGSFKTAAGSLGLTASNSNVTFGSVPVGLTASQYIKVLNQGSAPVRISKLDVSGATFSSSAQGSLPITVDAGSSFNLGVQFSPTVPGAASGKVMITDSTGASPLAVNISGTGTAVPAGTLAAPAATLNGLTCASSLLTGSTTDVCTVTMDIATSSDVSVNLTSDNSAVTVPAFVTVPTGATSAVFTAAASALNSVQTVTLTASASGASQTFTLQLGAAIADLDVSSLDVSFGDVSVDGHATLPLVLTSTGNTPVTVDAASIAGPWFSISGASYPLTLNPNQTAIITVQFDPKSSGIATGQLTLSSNATTNSNKKIKLSANAVPQVKKLSCAASAITESGTDICSVTLNATAPAGGLAVALASSSSAVMLPASIMVPASATNAAFTATAASPVTSSQTVMLTASTTGSSQTFSLQLNTSVPTLAISATSLMFGNVTVNTPATQTLTLSSTGTAAVIMSGAAVTGSGFTVSGVTFPLTLNPGQTATLAVQFNPTVVGAATGQLTLSSNSSSGTSAAISLSGTGTGVPDLSSLSCASGSITGAGTESCIVTLNAAAASGGFAVNLASNNSAVTVPSSVTVPAGATTSGFTATVGAVSSTQTATLTATAGGVSKTFALQLNLVTAQLSINATTVTFGNVNLNTPATQSVTLTSTGSLPVTVSSAVVAGTGFTLSGGVFPATLNPGQSTTLYVQFDPTTAGSATGTLTIASTSSTNPTASIALSGAGTSTATEVDLLWNAPTNSAVPVVGYNVYRSPSGTGSYQLMNSSIVSQTTYIDKAIQAGQIYDYYVVSVDGSGVTSVPSNTTTVAIP